MGYIQDVGEKKNSSLRVKLLWRNYSLHIESASLCPFKYEHNIQPPISSLFDGEHHCLSYMSLPNGIFYDRIEAWLEESHSSNVPMNYRCHISNIVDRVYHALILIIFTLFLFQVLFLIFCLEHVYGGLGLQGWLHWHYEFT
jgi:hypothetical protein